MFSDPVTLVLCPLLPLLAAIATAVLGPRLLRGYSHWPTWLALAGSLICSGLLLRSVYQQASTPTGAVGMERVVELGTWVDIRGAYDGSHLKVPFPLQGEEALPFRVPIALRLDPLTAVMLATVNLVALLVAIYAQGYMRGDPGYWRFFSFVALFAFSMNMLVTASNFVLMFVFWEGVGLCSYLLIGFWYERPAAAAAGTKAFLVNRIGDFGFLIGLFLIWLTYGSLDFHDTKLASGETYFGVLGQARLASQDFVGGGLGLAICLLLFLAACGKSAQLPLHVWLADAMEGPTPVSALIHAATMVTAGVYLVARCTPLFIAAPLAQLVVAVVGGATALMAALIALTQFDLKRVFAYSTISQLGYMFLGLGAGTWAGITAGMFHLVTHAFFKALLFLAAGSVMHAMGNVTDLRRLGGLRRILPWTHVTFAVGCLTLAGILPLSGFWSKDAILGALRDQSLAMQQATESQRHAQEQPVGRDASAGELLLTSRRPDGPNEPELVQVSLHEIATGHLAGRPAETLRRGACIYYGLYLVAMVTSGLTAIYTFRVFFWTFYGPEIVPPEARGHAHESPAVMVIPLVLLALLSAGVGWLCHAHHRFAHFLQQTPSLAIRSVRQSPAPDVFHADVALWSTLVAVIGIGLASFLYLGSRREAAWLRERFSQWWAGYAYYLSRDKFFVDEIEDVTVVRPLSGFARLLSFLDSNLIDGLVDLVGTLPRRLGGLVRRWQSGLVNRYGLIMVLGVAVLVGVRLWWGD